MKELQAKTERKLMYYREKSLKLDDTVMINDSRIEKLQTLNTSLEETGRL